MLIAAIVAGFGVYYILATTNPVVMADGWYFVDAWLIPWQDGSFTPADLWAKRHGNHAQPFAALVFIANAEWFGLDMAYETLVGIVLAAIFGGLCYLAALRWQPSMSTSTRAWLIAAVVCIVFSINANDKISWSIVGLFYFGHCLGLIFLGLVATQRQRPRPLLLLLATLVLCALIDDTGMLWCAAAIACLAATWLRAPAGERRSQVVSIAMIVVALAIYLPSFRWLAPVPDGPPMPELGSSVAWLVSHVEGAWKALLPFGAAYAREERLATLVGADSARFALLSMALICVASHVWMWAGALARRADDGRFVACGLALYAYGTIAGVMLNRVPLNGWDYLLQPRYGVFYDFLLLAPVLAWACRAPSPGTPPATRALGTTLLVLPCILALAWLRAGRAEIPWIQSYYEDVARDTWALMQQPERVPEDCNPFVALCDWDERTRRRLIGSLTSGAGLNLASEAFRNRHDLRLSRVSGSDPPLPVDPQHP